MNLENKTIAVIGIGYVGLQLAIEFSKNYKVIGYDIDKSRISELKLAHDRTSEVDKKDLNKLKKIKFTYDERLLSRADIYIITVPTPIDKNKKPNLTPLISSSETVGSFIEKGNIVIYESTVYPGCTEELCVPILEKKSNLKYNFDFFCGYSPERINPGDFDHKLTNITKIVSGSNNETLDFINKLYKSIIKAGTHKASSIKIAEAAKIIENIQRDVNIALINEFALIFDKLDINTSEVLSAASTKWNFINFRPGLVGGHCIGVDPYYLTHKAIEVGYHPEIILAGRKINDNVGSFIAQKTISELVKLGVNPSGAKVAVLGLTFKENCPDLRNSKVVNIIQDLKSYNCKVLVSDNVADKKEAFLKYGIELVSLENIKNQDAIILAVSHEKYISFDVSNFRRLIHNNGIVIDIKSVFSASIFENTDIKYWQL